MATVHGHQKIRMRGVLTWWMASLVTIGVVVGIVIAGTTTWMVNATGTDKFCATECHSMQWATYAYEQGPHYVNHAGVRASCVDCHIPFESGHPTPFQYIFGTLWTKGGEGARDVYEQMRGEISDKAKWDAEKPRLSAAVRAWFKQTNCATCQGCHKLDAFASSGASAFMADQAHSGLMKADKVDCLECHAEVAHRYSAAPDKP